MGFYCQAKLPSVLRLYRDTLTADMKTAIKTAVAELLPVLIIRPLESEFSTGEKTSDADGELTPISTPFSYCHALMFKKTIFCVCSSYKFLTLFELNIREKKKF